MMRRLQASILYLLIHLAILFNIERLDLDGKDTIDLATAVYPLALLAIITILSIKVLRRLPLPVLIALWTAVYFVIKLVLISQRPLVGGIYTYLSFTELGLFLIAVFLAQKLGLDIEEYQEAARIFAFANVSKIKRVEEAQEEIQTELYRSRRFQRPLSIIVLEQDESKIQANINKVVLDVQDSLMKKYISAMVARELSAQLRQTDILLEHDKKGRLIILSPDTDDDGIKAFIHRLSLLARNDLFSINFGAATFPNHALTFEQLLEQAESNLQQQIDTPLSMDTPIDAPKEVEVS
jgi:GGDEF domain-containing protein